MQGFNSDNLFEKSYDKPNNINQLTMQQTYECYGSNNTHKYFIFRRQYVFDLVDTVHYTVIDNDETFLIPIDYASVERYIKKPFQQDWRIYRYTVPVEQPRDYEGVVKDLYWIDLKKSLQSQHNGYALWEAVRSIIDYTKE